MKYKFLNLVEKLDGKYIDIHLDNPPVNALSKSLINELNFAIDDIRYKYSGLIIRSSKLGFSAGADLKERAKMCENETLTTLKNYKDLFKKIELLPFPTIALLDKYALGGGLELSLAADFRFAVKSCIIGFPETSIGIIPGAGGTQRLTKLIGLSKSKKWIFSAKKFTAVDAYRDNVIDEIFENQEEMCKYANGFMKEILQNCKIALQAAKISINSSNDSSNEEDVEFREYKKTLESPIRKKILEQYLK
ncbi:MAG: enoyl-CoA hydratase [Candidatus Marinimicrobia bacterium]|nr:enoyl-CoA hydratase [Candidatus Neomarinimicrobiota bacterium]